MALILSILLSKLKIYEVRKREIQSKERFKDKEMIYSVFKKYVQAWERKGKG